MVERFSPDIEQALRLLAAEDARQAKLHELLETIREQIRLEVAPEHRPEGLFQNIQDAVYAMRGRTPLMNDAAITAPLRARSSAGIEDRPIRQIDLGSISRYEEHTGESFEPDDEALIFLNDDNEQTCHVEGPNAKAMAAQIVAAVRSSTPAQPSDMREALIRVAASLAAAISILERTPSAKKAAPSNTMFEMMLSDYRKALEFGRTALAMTSTDRQNIVASDPSPEKIDPKPEPLL